METNNLTYSVVISFNVNLQGTSLLQLNAGESKLNVIKKKKNDCGTNSLMMIIYVVVECDMHCATEIVFGSMGAQSNAI